MTAFAIFILVVGGGSFLTIMSVLDDQSRRWVYGTSDEKVQHHIANHANQVLQEVRMIPDGVWQDTAQRQSMILDILNKHNVRDYTVMQHLIEELSTDDVDQQFSQMLLEHESYTQREIAS